MGVDVGTGGARAVAIDRHGAVAATATAPYPNSQEWPPGRAVSSAWRTGCLDALEAVGRRAGVAPAAVAVGGQSPTTVDRDGTEAITVRHPAGHDLDNPARQQAQRAVLDEASPTAVTPRQLWDWLLWSLGADDVQGRWPGDPTLDGFGERRGTGEIVGSARADRGLPAGTTLVTGAQDAYLAFWAGGLDRPGLGMDPGGSSGGLAVAVPTTFDAPGLWTFASAARDVAVAGGPVNAHGTAVEWLARVVGKDVDELVTAAATVRAGANGVLFLPYLEGERAPRWDARLRGVLAGLGPDTGAGELARAVLEGTACGLGHLASVLREAGAVLDTVVFAGRPAGSELWCRIKAAVMGVVAEVPTDRDLAAYGAALAAGAGLGWWPRPGEGEQGAWPRPAMRRLEPLREPAYLALLERFVAAGDLIQEHPRLFGGTVATASHMET